MRVLGAILAGGQSRRFGGDKGAALLGGRALIDHVADGLRPQVDALVISGRDWPGIAGLADRPGPGLGPLGGLNAALHAAQQKGFGAVLTAGCDVLPVPEAALAPGEVIDGHWLTGLWPAALAGRLDAYLAGTGDRSLRGWIAASGMRPVTRATVFHNLNTRSDLAHYAQARGLAA